MMVKYQILLLHFTIFNMISCLLLNNFSNYYFCTVHHITFFLNLALFFVQISLISKIWLHLTLHFLSLFSNKFDIDCYAIILLQSLFKGSGDIYRAMAAQILGKSSLNDVTLEERNKAKVICLGNHFSFSFRTFFCCILYSK